MSKFYLTTPIFYVNDVPHIGHAYSTISADAIARWRRMAGDDVFFMTGTDEHGLKVQRAAEANGISPIEQADKMSRRFEQAWDMLNISHNYFMRTTRPEHHKAVQALLTKCYENGHIYKSTYDGLYSVSDEAYVSQADVDAGLVQGEVEHMVEENYFFKLSAFEEPLLKWYESAPENVAPTGYRNEALGIIKAGLEDLSITRSSLKWGVKVPWDESQVFYVWYDALINYATAVGYGSSETDFKYWWEAAHHIVGKDILRFHAVYWPAMLMAAGIEDMPKIRVHGFLLVGGEKMAKRKANSIPPADLVKDFGPDGFRYCLLRDNPFGSDTDFSYEQMQARYNADLANGLGNLLGRVSTLVETKCEARAPAADKQSPLSQITAQAYESSAKAWEDFNAAKALAAVFKIVDEANEMLSSTEPWNLDPGKEVESILGSALEAVRIAALLMFPAMPATSQELYRIIGMKSDPADEALPAAAEWGQYEGGAELKKAQPLFPRMQ